ncbi:alkene reductase [Candidatus Desantisbacteria bacterium]|nr:alkene reductase [Candidatus Desantisbacteria bacterium]
MSNKLFSPAILGSITLKNHIVMAPMTRSRATQNIPNDLMAKYYTQRSGAGLIITEGTSPSPNGLGYARIPGIFSKEQVEGWKKVTAAVHAKGSKIFVQLMHTGRISHKENMSASALIIAPSAIAAKGQMWTDKNGMQDQPVPKEMTKDDIIKTKNEFIIAAKNAIEAGFDGIELHSANGYLLDQFLNPGSNQRKDEYGGSIENRCRFIIEVAEAAVKAIGKEKIGIRLSPYGAFNDVKGFEETEAEYSYLAEKLYALGLIYIHLVDHSSMGAPMVEPSTVLKIRKNFKNTLILSGGYDKERAEKDLQSGAGDLISFGKPFISNPDLVLRLEKGITLTPPDMNTFYTPGEHGYTDYPFAL